MRVWSWLGLALLTPVALAQSPLMPAPPDNPLASSAAYHDEGPASVPAGAIEIDGAVTPVLHDTSCSFDSIGHYNEMRSGARHKSGTLGSRLRGVWSDPDRVPQEDKDYCHFGPANCWSCIDVEKRLFVTYSIDGPQGRATQLGYGGANSAQVGLEALPWVLRDSPNLYSRWGGSVLFLYSAFTGFDLGIIQSKLSGRQLTITGGDSYALAFGPTFRTDFEILGVRHSPNVTGGLLFDWVSVDVGPPASVPPARYIRRVDTFKQTGFDVGGFLRFMWDIGLTDYLSLSMGMQIKFAPSDVMIAEDEYRKHMGFVIGLTHEF